MIVEKKQSDTLREKVDYLLVLKFEVKIRVITSCFDGINIYALITGRNIQ